DVLTSFTDFGLAEPILRALAQENYVTPTPIQAQAIPPAMSARDIVGIAQTGTGKTAAFALPILHQLAARPQRPERKTCRVLVLSPTREFSGQILDSFNAYGRHLGFATTLAIGGVPMGRQVRALMNGVDVLVATPGRLLDLVRGNALRLGRVEFLVLDEADRMLDMGFIHDIRKIVGLLPAARQTLFFSATMPQQIPELAKHMLPDPVRVAVPRGAPASGGPLGASWRRRPPPPRPSGWSSASPTSPALPSLRCWPACCARRQSTARSSSPVQNTAPTRSCVPSSRPASRRTRS